MGSHDLLLPGDWTFPVPIAFGPGRLEELPALCAAAGSRRPLLVTDRGSADLPFVQRATDAITRAGMAVAVFSDVSPNPTDLDIARGRSVFLDGGHDGVIAIGGGSGMDAGKAISLVATSGRPLESFDFDRDPQTDLDRLSFPPLLTIPTTAGTGAETESTAMVTMTDRGIKICVWHQAQKPRVAILDPELTLGLPTHLTAWTGLDALVHAIEAYSVPSHHPLCDGAALQAMRLISNWLPVAVDDGSNLTARAAMLTGSCLAGVAFLKGLGLVHGMSHMIGAVYDTHHGLTNAVLLPSVLRFNQPQLTSKIPSIDEALGLAPVGPAATTSATSDFDRLDEWVVSLLDQFDIPRGLVEIGVPGDLPHDLAHKVMGDAATGTNPRVPTLEEVRVLLQKSLHEAR